jgi:hypothetical protein
MDCGRYGVLLWGANGGGVPRTVEGMFDAFSASVRMASGVPHLLPQVCRCRLQRIHRHDSSVFALRLDREHHSERSHCMTHPYTGPGITR